MPPSTPASTPASTRPSRGRVRPLEAALRLLVGLFLCGTGVALLVRSGFGLGPWDVLHEGLAARTGLPIGRATIVVGAVVLLAWLPLRQRPGIGTLSNVLVVGLSVDAVLAVLDAPSGPVARAALAAVSVPVFGIGTGLYLGVDLGPGPRDGVMTGLAARGVPVATARTAIELTALVGGWALGGTVGVGTVWFALGVGPAVALALPLLRASWHRDGPRRRRPRTGRPDAARTGGPAPS